MGTGSGRPSQNPEALWTRPVPVPIFSQAPRTTHHPSIPPIRQTPKKVAEWSAFATQIGLTGCNFTRGYFANSSICHAPGGTGFQPIFIVIGLHQSHTPPR